MSKNLLKFAACTLIVGSVLSCGATASTASTTAGDHRNKPALKIQSSSSLQARRSVQGMCVVVAARSQIGRPYVYGAAGPHAYDCSGLTSWAYKQTGKTIPRTSYSQLSGGRRISHPQAGDIVISNGGGHASIYSGRNIVIHAPQPGRSVEEVSLPSGTLIFVRF